MIKHYWPTLQNDTTKGDNIIVTVSDTHDRDTNDIRDGLNFQIAGLTKTPNDNWNPPVRIIMMTPTKTMTQPQPPSG